jgi:hypothetical protein
VTIALYLSALRRARPRQLAARALRPVNRRRAGRQPLGTFRPLEGPKALWLSPAFDPSGIEPGPERLRRFHAAYAEDFRSVDELREPPRNSDTWHPYVVSTRAGNWIAAMSLRPELARKPAVESLRRQLAFVDANVEEDVLGNHVIRNARALVLGGAAFADERLLDHGRALLERELPDQILADGGHYERSPVYHLVVLRDLLELHATGAVDLTPWLDPMRAFAAALTRPDGAPALFNDGGLDLAPKLELPEPPYGLSVFPDTGYAVYRDIRTWLAFDCGPPAPDFLPAHAHADALSFQLWSDAGPLLVDPGSFTYEPGADRDWFRSTRAHSTLSLDGRNQFELWGAFRSGPLPDVRLVRADPGQLEATVAARGARHVRLLEWDANEVRVRDRVEGTGVRDVASRLVWAPGAAATAEPEARKEDGWVAERFFERVATRISVQHVRSSLPLDLGWRIPRLQ